jgi:hypothetical protein
MPKGIGKHDSSPHRQGTKLAGSSILTRVYIPSFDPAVQEIRKSRNLTEIYYRPNQG